MLLKLIATLILLYWMGQAAAFTRETWNQGYSLIWVAFQMVGVVALLLPLILIWR
jgi:hypothetical protein